MKWLLLALLLIIAGLSTTIWSCNHAWDLKKESKPLILSTGAIEEVQDCFGRVIDYQIEGYSLKKDHVMWQNTAGTWLTVTYEPELDIFKVSELDMGRAYSVKHISADFWWWHPESIYLGCTE